MSTDYLGNTINIGDYILYALQSAQPESATVENLTKTRVYFDGWGSAGAKQNGEKTRIFREYDRVVDLTALGVNPEDTNITKRRANEHFDMVGKELLPGQPVIGIDKNYFTKGIVNHFEGSYCYVDYEETKRTNAGFLLAYGELGSVKERELLSKELYERFERMTPEAFTEHKNTIGFSDVWSKLEKGESGDHEYQWKLRNLEVSNTRKMLLKKSNEELLIALQGSSIAELRNLFYGNRLQHILEDKDWGKEVRSRLGDINVLNLIDKAEINGLENEIAAEEIELAEYREQNDTEREEKTASSIEQKKKVIKALAELIEVRNGKTTTKVKAKTELQLQLLSELEESVKKPNKELAEIEWQLNYKRKIRNTIGGALELVNENKIRSLEQQKALLENNEAFNWRKEMIKKYK